MVDGFEGDTRAQVAGSGVKVDVGSPLTILAEQARTFAAQRDITAKVGATKAQSALSRGSMAANNARYSSYGAAANQFANLFSMLGGR